MLVMLWITTQYIVGWDLTTVRKIGSITDVHASWTESSDFCPSDQQLLGKMSLMRRNGG